MEKLVGFIISKRNIILLTFILVVVVSALLIPQVGINYNLSSYLPENSETIKALKLMTEEFGLNGSAQVMVKNISKEEAVQLKSRIETLKGVDTVTFSPDSEDRFKDSNALFSIAIESDDYSEIADEVIDGVRKELFSYDIYMNGGAINNRILKDAIETEIPVIAIIALVFIIAVLLMTATSWIEPLLFLLIAGFAIIINMGTNIVFGEISFITAAIAALLQLALSMDYSIMLLHRYREECEDSDVSPTEAMKKALKNSFGSIWSSSFTTIAGVLTMSVMSFTLGRDIGFVMGKGIFISVLCVFLLMPSFILLFDNLIKKTRKKALKFQGKQLASFAYKGRYILPFLMVILIAGSYFVQTNLPFSYSMKFDNPEEVTILQTFGENNQFIAIFPSTGEENFLKQQQFINTMENYQIDSKMAIKSIAGYTNTAGLEINASDAADLMKTDPLFVKVLFGLYAFDQGEIENSDISPYSFIEFVSKLGRENSQVGSLFGDNSERLAQFYLGLKTFNESFNVELTEAEFSGFMTQTYGVSLPAVMVSQLYDGNHSLPLIELIEVMYQSEALPAGMKTHLGQFIEVYTLMHSDVPYSEMMKSLGDIGKALSGQEMTLAIEDSLIKAVYVLYLNEAGEIPDKELTTMTLVNYASDLIEKDNAYSVLIDSDMRELLTSTQAQLKMADEMFRGENYSRILITTDLPAESDEIFQLIKYTREQMQETFGEEAYVVGEVTATYDMKMTFSDELRLITSITIITLLLIVALAFRSVSIPLILVVTIQGAFWMTMSFSTLLENPVFFIAYIIAQSLQMGATIDYGILFTSNYVEERAVLSKRDALAKAFAMSLPTIITSSTVLILATTIISLISSQTILTSICGAISTGTVVSTLFVLFGLPATLVLADRIIEKTTYKTKFYNPPHELHGFTCQPDFQKSDEVM